MRSPELALFCDGVVCGSGSYRRLVLVGTAIMRCVNCFAQVAGGLVDAYPLVDVDAVIRVCVIAAILVVLILIV